MLAADEGDDLAETDPMDSHQPLTMAVLLLSHAVEHVRRRRIRIRILDARVW